MTAQPRGTPRARPQSRYNKILHEHVIVLTVTTADAVCRTEGPDHCGAMRLRHLQRSRAKYGFMQDPHVPEALGVARDHGVELDPGDMIYFLGRETIIVTQRRAWRSGERLFVLMARNAVRATAFFRLPPRRVVELGVKSKCRDAVDMWRPPLSGLRGQP